MSSTSSSSSSSPFIQLVSFAAKDAASRDKFLSLWTPAIPYVTEHERGSTTLTYQGFLPADSAQPEGEQEVVIFETYTSKEEFERVHMGSETVKTFLKEVAAADVLARETQLNFLRSTGVGFQGRGEEREQQLRAAGTRPHALLVKFTFKSEEAVEKFLTIFRPLASYVESHEPNTLTYHSFHSVTDPLTIVIFERYVSKQDLVDTHMKSEVFLGLGPKIQEADILDKQDIRAYEEMEQGFWGKQ